MNQSKIDLKDEKIRPFEKPWHAELFATTVHLCDRGVFSWSEWTRCFGENLRLEGKTFDINGGDDYFKIWLQTLTEMVTANNITDGETISELERRWAAAYSKTPHGKAVTL